MNLSKCLLTMVSLARPERFVDGVRSETKREEQKKTESGAILG